MASPLNPTLRYIQGRAESFGTGEPLKREELDGILLAPFVPAARVAELRDKMVIRPDDVFIATFTKCGTTWMQHIVKLIVNNGVDNGINNDVDIPWLEQMTLEEIESMPSPRCFKSHLPYQFMPRGGNPEKTEGKYISMLRNPKDLVVSLYNHVKFFFPAQMVLPFDDFFDKFVEGADPYGSFHTYFLNWWAHKDASNILIPSYEQIKRDPRGAVIAVADFLGYKLSDEVIDKIVVATSFEKMKDNKAVNKEYLENITPSNVKFMRKGIIGDWKNVLTAEQSARIDALVAEKFAGSGIVFDYGDANEIKTAH